MIELIGIFFLVCCGLWVSARNGWVGYASVSPRCRSLFWLMDRDLDLLCQLVEFGKGIDPLSPHLFILVAQALSDGLVEFAANNVCRGIAVSSRAPRISHLLFADDCFIFMENNMDHAWCLKLLLDIYCA